MKNNNLELKMYFFTIYQLSGIQAGIQCGHAALEYAKTYGDTELFKNFVENHKTWIILNGGTTNSSRDFKGEVSGSLNKICDTLSDHDIKYSVFCEPDLENALTAVCFIADERVYNYEKYPDYEDAVKNNMWGGINYKDWVNFMGGDKNVFLRELIKGKKLA